jgi:hypothetical protein
VKAVVLTLAAAAALVLAACGSEKSAAPLALDQRVPTAQDAPGSKPDPVEKRVTVTGPGEFISRLGERFINPTPKEVADFKQSGFLRAIHDTRFFPATPGGPHTRNAVHIFSLVMQFKSDDGAQTALDFLNTDSLRPCPRKCATQIKEFDVDISDAHGVRRFATAEDIKATGDRARRTTPTRSSSPTARSPTGSSSTVNLARSRRTKPRRSPASCTTAWRAPRPRPRPGVPFRRTPTRRRSSSA